MEIKVLGIGCPNCIKLEQLAHTVCAENNINANIHKITDLNEFSKYGVMITPALIVNGRVLSQGKIPVKSTLTHWLIDANK